MKIKIEIDQNAGFCPGVNRIIRTMENLIGHDSSIITIGELIHNHEEINRLKSLGIDNIDYNEKQLHQIAGSTLVIRAHGMPVDKFEFLSTTNNKIVDGTCPIVKRSMKIVEEYVRKGYHIIFVGKKGHAETASVTSYAGDNVTILETEHDIQRIPSARKYLMLAQTTVRRDVFNQLVEKVRLTFRRDVIIKDSICKFVMNREEQLKRFALQHDLILMVGGKHSSNTKWLYNVCKEQNQYTYWIESQDDINHNWFNNYESVGITGSASTPLWLLENIRDHLIKKIS
ncbi:MAG: 4-hydroxy-3-methylbut-2-enyl diphosphate reductase [Calditrichia bacterium]